MGASLMHPYFEMCVFEVVPQFNDINMAFKSKADCCDTTAHHHVVKGNLYSRTALQLNIGL